MSDNVGVEWELPRDVLGRIFERFWPKTLAKCSCVAKAWNDVTKEDRFAGNVGLERAWRCGTVVPKCVQFRESQSLSIEDDQDLEIDNCVKRGEMVAILCRGNLVLVNEENAVVSHSRHSAPMYFSPMSLIDGMLLFGFDNNVAVLQIPELDKIATLSLHIEVQVIVDVEEHVAIGGESGCLELWSKASWTRAKVLNDGEVGEKEIASAAFAKEAGLLVCGLSVGHLEVWSLAACTCVRTLKGHDGCVQHVDVNKNLIISGSHDDETVRIWSQETGECVRLIDTYFFWAGGVVALSESRFAHWGGGIHVVVSDIATGHRLHTFDVGNAYADLFMTEDKLTVVRNDGMLLVWDFLAYSRSEE